MSAWIRSVGVVSPAGTGTDALVAALAAPDWRPRLGLAGPDAETGAVATCPDFGVKGLLPPMVARRMDRPSRLLAVAALEALAAVGDDRPWDPDRTAITAGTWNAGTDALVEILRTVFQASPDEAPPMQFPSTVANAAASQLGILEKLGGPNLTFAEKQVGGLRAITEAVRLIDKGRADAALAGGVDEAQWLNAEGYDRLGVLRRGMVLGEGAAVLLLAADPGPMPVGRVTGWGSASSPAEPWSYPDSPDGLVTACRTALDRAALAPAAVDAVVSLHNGLAEVAALEERALRAVFGASAPALISVTDRLGEGAVAGALRVAVAALTAGGRVTPSWPLPEALSGRGFGRPVDVPRTVLVEGVAGGGSSVALVVSAAR